MNTLSMMRGDIARSEGWRRDEILRHEQEYICRRIKNSLSYKEAIIDGVEKECVILTTDDANKKTLISMPGEDLPLGGYVEFAGCYWLIVQKDFDTEVYAKAKIEQCNYLLKWISDGKIVERWSVVYDGTKYLTGEYADRDFITTRGDTRITVTLPRDDETLKLNRESRFIIDDGVGDMLAYRLTKPLRVGSVYNDSGVFVFVLQEVNTEKDDNLEERIANYYRWFPQDGNDAGDDVIQEPPSQEEYAPEGERRMWF